MDAIDILESSALGWRSSEVRRAMSTEIRLRVRFRTSANIFAAYAAASFGSSSSRRMCTGDFALGFSVN